MKSILRCTASVAVLTMFAATAAYAQEERANTVDEIIVTAQKREQKLQDVPIVVTSLSQQVLEGAGVKDIKDLQILTPGLTVTSTSNETVTTARIRASAPSATTPASSPRSAWSSTASTVPATASPSATSARSTGSKC